MLTKNAIDQLEAAGFRDLGDGEFWFRAEEPYRGDKSKFRTADFIRITDMGPACGADGHFIVEAENTSFDYLHDRNLFDILEGREGARDILHAQGRVAFRTYALAEMVRYGIADPQGYGKSNWTVTEDNLDAAIDLALRVTEGQYVNLPEIIESNPVGY